MPPDACQSYFTLRIITLLCFNYIHLRVNKNETLYNIHAVKNKTLFMITVVGFTLRLSPYKTKTVV